MSAINQERQILSSKLEQISQELSKKEKELLTLGQKKEQIEITLKRKEESWDQMKLDLVNEKNLLSEKLEEMRKK